ncbi:MAG: PspC domain-containing protein [Oscillospiraceae bacterium]|nr:PspC domain-containing protein [Oscillospiraceae bacterium]
MNGKKLYKSKTDKKICGVCGGLAEFLGIDVTIVRLIWVLVILFAGFGLLAYIVCALILPEKPDGTVTVVNEDDYTGPEV